MRVCELRACRQQVGSLVSHSDAGAAALPYPVIAPAVSPEFEWNFKEWLSGARCSTPESG